MGLVLWVRSSSGPPTRHAPKDLLAEGGSVKLEATTPIAATEDGPFLPLGIAVEREGRVRDALLAEIPIPSLRDHRRIRAALLFASFGPIAMLLELDRELVVAKMASPGRLFVDLVLGAYVVFELTRRTPRLPGIAALALAAIALRWTLTATRACGHDVHPLVWLAAILAAGSAITMLLRVPPRSRIALELLAKLGVDREAWNASKRTKPPPAGLVAFSIAAAAGLPGLLHVVRQAGVSMLVQSAIFTAYAIVAPMLVRRLTKEDASFFPKPKENAPSPRAIMFAIAGGLALAAAAVTAGNLFYDTGAELARCVGKLDAEAKRALAAKSSELSSAVARVRASAPLVLLTSVVFPFADERIYRGLLQDALVRKYGFAYGLFAASIVFGVAHLGVYQVALYQTALLGIGFGIAYIEGGLLAAFIVHATWNLILLT